jgi:hypothetical protein
VSEKPEDEDVEMDELEEDEVCKSFMQTYGIDQWSSG